MIWIDVDVSKENADNLEMLEFDDVFPPGNEKTLTITVSKEDDKSRTSFLEFFEKKKKKAEDELDNFKKQAEEAKKTAEEAK